MIQNQKIVVVLPAYNCELTLEKTYKEIPFDIVDEVILVDDHSTDQTIKEAQRLQIKHILHHSSNKGYGANQKTCYNAALELDADIIIMLHPDYQYTPLLIKPMCEIIVSGLYKVVIGSRILGNGALKGGMPIYKYIANRFLTFAQNLLIGQKLSEYHTGYRAFSREVLENLNFTQNSDDFIFDNQIIMQVFEKKYAIAEITCPTKYSIESSSIGLKKSIVYGFGVLKLSLFYFFYRRIFNRLRL